MKRPTARFSLAITAAALVAMGSVVVCDAGPATGNAQPPSKEQREEMARAHEKMAACLRSDRPFADCHQEMMQTCRDVSGGRGCGMGMGQGATRGAGMRRGQGMTGKQTGTTQP